MIYNPTYEHLVGLSITAVTDDGDRHGEVRFVDHRGLDIAKTESQTETLAWGDILRLEIR